MTQAKKINITSDDISGAGGANQITPGDYEASVVEVSDHIAKSGNEGWKWTVQVGRLKLTTFTMFTPNAKWKLIEVMSALGIPMETGEVSFDPQNYIGKTLGVELIEDPNDSRYLEINKFFPVGTKDVIDTAKADEVDNKDVPF
ncbi:MAG: hypothetical protein CMQ02_10245 [Gammaproteobacteria bacterium]|nr:hypothetical protein [uncultured phage MedDCM-OCT-S08-C495]MAV33795.1 hypothetical protein [Gammaproteobacteria bacterium]BAR30946.1 hypothetical protein [uncultured Mediterranean phage uvMED]|tara:strand:- start:1417 stop:1848 length:432 start_codon:yes stop_codon:yes gene_type:complete